jgi:Protein of unknown function (DUF1569)
MALPSVYTTDVAQQFTNRVNQLQASAQPLWGKMNVAQMLAHCNVAYELAYENKHPRPNAVMRFFLKLFVKQIVTGEKPYTRNMRTAPVFLVSNQQDFELQQKRLLTFITKTQEAGAAFFEGKENPGFGTLTATEWNNLFYKHLNHHLAQFGA